MLIDSHVHFWNPNKVDTPFITPEFLGPDLMPLYRVFHPTDLQPDLETSGIAKVVVVNAGSSVEDNVAMLTQAEDYDWIGAVVGSIPIWDHAETRRLLERYKLHGKFRGIRPLEEGARSTAGWYMQPENLIGLRILSEYEFVLEVLGTPEVYEQIPDVAEAVPDLRIVLNHLASPPIRSSEMHEWSASIAAAAACPNVYAKVSEVISHVDWPSWTDWTAADFQAQLDYSIEVFDADRLMFGSGWPGVTLVGGYEKWWTEVNRALQGRSKSDVEAILGGTAQAAYRIAA